MREIASELTNLAFVNNIRRIYDFTESLNTVCRFMSINEKILVIADKQFKNIVNKFKEKEYKHVEKLVNTYINNISTINKMGIVDKYSDRFCEFIIKTIDNKEDTSYILDQYIEYNKSLHIDFSCDTIVNEDLSDISIVEKIGVDEIKDSIVFLNIKDYTITRLGENLINYISSTNSKDNVLFVVYTDERGLKKLKKKNISTEILYKNGKNKLLIICERG